MKGMYNLLETLETLQTLNATLARSYEEDTFQKGYFRGKANAYELAYEWLAEEINALESATDENQ